MATSWGLLPAIPLLALACSGRCAADARADALLKQAASRMENAKSMTADMDVTYTRTDRLTGARTRRGRGVLRLMRPKYAYIAYTSGDMHDLTAADGKDVWFMHGTDTYVKKSLAHAQARPSFHMVFQVDYFFDRSVDIFGSEQTTKKGPRTSYLGKRRLDGAVMDVVAIESGGEVPANMELYLDANHIIRRWITRTGTDRVKLVYDATLRNVRLNAHVTPESFAYAPPATAKPFEMPNQAARLLAVGAPAPDFTLATPDSGTIALAAEREKGKATLINFWFYG